MEPAVACDRPTPRVFMALVCLYAPYSWLLFLDGSWDSYRWQWLRMWPLLPGLLAHAIPGVHQQPDWVGHLVMAAAATLIFAAIVALCRMGWRVSIVVAVVIGLLSAANSWIAYHFYLF